MRLYFSGNKFTPRKGLKRLLDIRNALVVNVKDPQAGVWKMNVESEGRHTIRITGLSTTNFVAGFSRKPVNHIEDSNHRPVAGNFN
jgi:hemicentin